jgi:hypothetical protein
MNIRGIFEGSFESVWSMYVPDEVYKSYMDSHPEFNSEDREDMEDMWDYFKSQGCYDEPDDSVDHDTHITGLELPDVQL